MLYIILFITVIWFVLNTSIISEKLSTKVKNVEKKIIKGRRDE